MVSEVAAPPSLARIFTDSARLPDLLCLPRSEWGAYLHAERSKLDHVLDADLPSGEPVYEQMAADLEQFVRRIGLLHAEELTAEGDAIARIGGTPLGDRTAAHDRLLEETLAAGIGEHYRGDGGRPVVTILQNAAHLVSRVPGDWAGYCPGLLLGEVRHLLMLAHADAQRAQRLVEGLVTARRRVAASAGMTSPRSDWTRMDNTNAYGHLINAFHMRRLRRAGGTGMVPVTETEARATWILLTGAGLLVDVDTLGTMHCLSAPLRRGTRPPPSLTEPAPVVLNDGSVWDRGMQAGLVSVLMMYLMNHEFDALDQHVFPSLAIDMESRRDAANLFGGDPREIARHRHANKALAMELLTAMLLARLDSAREIRCYCETRNGLPHKHAPAGLTDVEAYYDEPPPGFYVIVAASAKEDVTRDHYGEQLAQALEHAGAVAEVEQVPVYAMVLNGGNMTANKGLRQTFAAFATYHGMKRDDPVRLLPVWAPSLACALGDLDAKLPPEAFRFDTGKLTNALDLLVAGAFSSEEKEDPDWARKVWSDVVVGEDAVSTGPRPRQERPPEP